MEPVLKKTKLTSHFRVALRPQNANVQGALLKDKKIQRPLEDIGKENGPGEVSRLKVGKGVVELIVVDDEDEKSKENNVNPKPIEQDQKARQTLKKLQQITVPEPKSKSKPEPAPKPVESTTVNIYHSPAGLRPELDHDRGSLHDVHCEPHYALESFIYDRKRELQVRTMKYLDNVKHKSQQFTASTRAKFINWVVHLQDNFVLWSDSIYMTVKLTDQYLMRKSIHQRDHQLIYLTSLLISSKFEERLPPVEIDNLLEAVQYRYSRRDIIRCEADILRTLDFNLRFPLSFGFLRRFVHATRSNIETLHLSRFILESSLLDYEMIEELESKMAAASLYLAFKMLHNTAGWSEAAEFYTQYKKEDLEPIIPRLNDTIRKNTFIKKKYSHEVFMSVATRIPPLLLRRPAMCKEPSIVSLSS